MVRLLPVVVAVVASCTPTTNKTAPLAAPPGGESADARVLAIGDEVVADLFEESPERVALWRVPGARYDSIPDGSIAFAEARDRHRRDLLQALRATPRSSLSDPRAALAYDVAEEFLEGRTRARVCRSELWNVSPMNGWQVGFSDLAEAQPVGTPDLRGQTLARFGKIPAYIDDQIRDLREGLARGYAANRRNAVQVKEQLDQLAALPPTESPYFGPARRDTDAQFQQQMAAIIQDGIDPAIRRYRDFLQAEYVPAARDAASVAANPDGAACYRAMVRLATTLDRTPEEIHDLGERELARLEEQMRALSARSFGGEPPRALLQRLRADPQYRYRDRDELRQQATRAIARAKEAAPRAFDLLPKADVTVEAIPPFQEKTASAHYLVAALDGTRTATFRIRLYQAEQQSRAQGESVAFHETIPGHHLQISIASERPQLPPVSRFVFHSGFAEGWGLYAEHLADELGLYSDDVERMGMLSASAWRAVRLVVDTGLHAMGWTRDRAIATLLEHTAMSPDQVAAEVDRYISWPGQATAYMVGYVEIRSLREEAQRELGERFDLRAFHDRVLENGSVPLPVLSRRVRQWIAEVKSGQGTTGR